MLRLITVAIAVSACSSRSKTRPAADDAAPPPPRATPADAAPGPPPVATRKPLPRAKTDPLWRLAPARAVFGAVVADGGFETLGAGVAGLGEILALDPEGAALWARWTGKLRDAAGFDVANIRHWRAAGLDPGRGGALFGTIGSDAAMILPVANSDSFRVVFKVVSREVDGRQLDVSPMLGYCREVGGRYACADSVDLLEEVAAQKPGELGERALALPDSLRGTAEVVTHLKAFPRPADVLRSSERILGDADLLAIAVRAGGGRLTAEAWLEGKRGGWIGDAFARLGKPASLRPHLAGATGVVAVHAPLREIFGLTRAGAISVGSTDLTEVIIKRLTGQVALITRGTGLTGGLAVTGLDDASKLAAGMPAVCRVVRELTREPTSIAGDRCRTALSARTSGLPVVPGLPAALQKPIPVDIAAAGDAMVISVGDARPGPGSASGFVLEPAHFVSWGRSLDPLTTAPLIEAKLIEAAIAARLEPSERARLSLTRRLANHVYELGIRARLDADGLRASLEVVSFAADPADVYAAYRVAINRLLAGDLAGYRAQLGVLGRKHPDTLVAEQAAMVERGTPAVGLGTALYAAIAIQSSLKYIAR